MIIDFASKIAPCRPLHASAQRIGGLLLLGVASSLAGCMDPPIDTRQPTVTGVIEGAVQYIGPRVQCTYVDGVPVEVDGRILMTLNDVDNPLPPEGTATQPADFFAIGGEDIFVDLATDCMPEAATAADRAVNIQRTIPFSWGAVKMGSVIPASELDADGNPASPAIAAAHTKRYKIQGFYDQEGDFNPLFSVAQSTSSGDIAGGALANPLGSTAFRIIEMRSVTVNPLGDLVPNVNVTLAAPVLTDPPIYRVASGAISSQATVPLGAVGTSMPLIELTLYERTAAPGDARSRLDSTMTALDLGGFTDFSSIPFYAWYVGPVDVDGSGDTDCPNGGGDSDCHPLLGALGIEWNSPIVLMQRMRTAIELAANVPTVAIIPNAGMESSNPTAQYPEVPMRVYPLAAMVPNPAHPECQAAFFASGSNTITINGAATALPAGAIIECSELPTGYYSVNALQGIVATPSTHVCPNPMDPGCPVVDASNSETGMLITGGQFGAQVWSVPNELGNYHQVGDPVLDDDDVVPPPTDANVCLDMTNSDAFASNLCVPEQSVHGAVLVHDPNVANPYGRRDPAAEAAMVCTSYAGAFATNSWADDPNTELDYNDFCCRPIQHLCNVPLCPYVTTTPTWANDPGEMNVNLRGTPTRILREVKVVLEGVEHTYGVPDCISFPMPSQCCGTGNQP